MKIAILGYGKMGKTIEGLAIEGGHEIVLRIGATNVEDLTSSTIQKADVAIEFSRPETAFRNIKFCLEHQVPVVSGTTAWLDRLEEAQAICREKKGAFFYASNFSIGVNVFFEINKHLAHLMNRHPMYAVAMEEIHHTQKLDAPSGTAISLAEDILEQIDRKSSWINASTTQDNVLSIISKRIDDVAGTHQICYESPIDTIEIKHTAHNREGFAKGALLAASWLIGRTGCFSMRDLLQL